MSTLFLHPSLCCFMYVDEKLVAIYIKSKKNLDVLNLNIYLTTTRTTTNTPLRRHQHKAIGSKRGFFHMQMSPFAYLFGGVCFVCCNKEICCCCWPGPFCWERASISNWFPALLLIHLMRLFEDRPLWLLFALHAFSPWHDSSSASLGDPNTMGLFEIRGSGSWLPTTYVEWHTYLPRLFWGRFDLLCLR